jgi:hypothetical protein
LVDYDVGQFRRRTTEQRPRTSNLDWSEMLVRPTWFPD